MKKATLFLSLLFATFGTAQTTPDQYNITVTCVHPISSPAMEAPKQNLDVVIEGKKFQLAAPNNGYLLALGDYKAKLVKEVHKTAYESIRVYELQFPDMNTRKFDVTGQSE